MFRLTREVRFAINAAPDPQLESLPTNSFGGYPSLTGLGYFFALDVTVRGQLDPATDYLINIKDIDQLVRREIVPLIAGCIRAAQFGGGGIVVREILATLHTALAPVALESVALKLTPTLSLACFAEEHSMVRLSQKFEFSASHRLHNARLTDEQNRQSFGKCNNPHGHGHNYELEVTIVGEPDTNGVLMQVPQFERIVDETIIKPFDHRNLNVEIAEFRELNPTVENIAMVIYRKLRPALSDLASVTLWETPKTWARYSEDD